MVSSAEIGTYDLKLRLKSAELPNRIRLIRSHEIASNLGNMFPSLKSVPSSKWFLFANHPINVSINKLLLTNILFR